MEIKCIPFMETRVSHPKVCCLASLAYSAVLGSTRQYAALRRRTLYHRTTEQQHVLPQHNLDLYKLKDVMSSPVAAVPVLCT
jgi:hypothetical protein